MAIEFMSGSIESGRMQSRALTPREVATGYATPEEEAAAWGFIDGMETRGFSVEEETILMGGSSSLSGSGMPVSEHTALQVSVVFACCRVIAEDVAKMQRFVMRRTFNSERGSAEAREEWHHPLASVVADYWCDPTTSDIMTGRPNTWMTGFEFWEFMVFQAALFGMSAAFVVRDPSGSVAELLPLRHGSCQPEIDARGWVVGHRIMGYGQTFIARTGDVLILRGPMADEVNAFQPMRLAREAIGLALAIERSQTRFHRNDMRPSGVLQLDLGVVSDTAKGREAIENIRADWARRYGPGGDGGIAILDRKFDFKELMVKGTDAQTIENRRFQIEEICRVLRVNPVKIMHHGATARGSVEQESLSHVSDTVGVWGKRCAEACNRDLVDRYSRSDAGLYIDFDDAALVRGTMSERMSGYERMLKAGWSPNEVRIIEGYNPLPLPEMDRPQLLANNTGLTPSPLREGTTPAKPSAMLPLPHGSASPALVAKPIADRPSMPRPDVAASPKKGLRHAFSRFVSGS